MGDTNLTEENVVKEEIETEEAVEKEEIKAEEAVEKEEIKAEEAVEKEEIKADETVEKKENTSTEENDEESVMTESEYLEAQKEAMKKNIRSWTGVLIYLLVVGLLLCILVYGFLMLATFVIDLIYLKKTKKMLERLENGEADVKEVYEFYEAVIKRGGLSFMLNFFCGGGFGLIGTIINSKMANPGFIEGEKVLGDDYKNERIANDPNAQWNYCIYCKKNKTEAMYKRLHKMKDGVICDKCVLPYRTMFPKRLEDPALIKHKETAHYMNFMSSLLNISSKEMEERLEYLKKNQEEYSGFTPTRVICNGCLELDETNSLFRIAFSSDHNSKKVGEPSGLVHPYSAVKGIAYEMVYEYETPDDNHNGGWEYQGYDSIVLAIDNPYLKEETFALDRISTKLFESTKKNQNENAEQTVKELSEIFGAPILESRKLHL